MSPLLACFTDTENRVRYFACESLYNIAKVSKGAILVYFNPIFDALSKVSTLVLCLYGTPKSLSKLKLVADSEISVKNGAELVCFITGLVSLV